MPLDPDVVEAVREMDEHELRRLLMLARARLESRGVAMGAEAPRVRYREQLIRCGKENCTWVRLMTKICLAVISISEACPWTPPSGWWIMMLPSFYFSPFCGLSTPSSLPKGDDIKQH